MNIAGVCWRSCKSHIARYQPGYLMVTGWEECTVVTPTYPIPIEAQPPVCGIIVTQMIRSDSDDTNNKRRRRVERASDNWAHSF